MFLADLSAFPN